MVKDIIKKGLVIGLAVAKLTRQEAERTVKFLVKEGKVAPTQSRKLLSQINKEADVEKQKLQKMMKEKMLTEKEASMLKKEVALLRKSLSSALRTGRSVAGSAYRRIRK